MDGFIQDIRYAARKLSRQPGFTLVALLTLALGIGANAVLFTLVNAVLLKPPAGVAAPDRLVSLYTSDYSSGDLGASSYADYEDFAAATDVLAGTAAYQAGVTFTGTTEQPVRVGIELISASYFSVLGTQLRGRAFSAGEWETGAPVVVVSHVYWQRQMGSAADAIGSEVLLNGRPVTVIGIAAEGFRGARRGLGTDVWLAVRTAAALNVGTIDMQSRGDRGISVIARLQPDVTIDAAQQRMRRVAAQLFEAYPERWSRLDGTGRAVTVISERASRVPVQVRTQAFAFTAMLSVVVLLVLLICCANVAGLMLARARGLMREMGIRLSIGASRARLARLLLVESALLASLAAIVVLCATLWIEEIVQRLLPNLPFPIALDFSTDHRVVLFTSFVALLAAVLFGAVPALRASDADPHLVMKDGTAPPTGRGRFSFRSVLVAAQVAASIVLLVTALLFVRSMRSALTTDLGFATDDVALLDLEPQPGFEPDEAEALRAAVAAIERLEATPGVSAATWANDPPLTFDANRRSIRVEGHQPAPGEDMEVHFSVVGPTYLTTMGIPLLRGRDLELQDRTGALPVLLVNESFAERFWPGQDPIGRRLMYDGENFATVIGVARDARLLNLGAGDIPGHIFIPALQIGWWGTTLHVRADELSPVRLRALRDVVTSTSPRWEARDVHSMTQQVAGSILPQRIASAVLAIFGTLALFLSAVGLYGVIAYAVAQRTHEFGIRFALGASARDVLQLLLRQGLRVILAGAAFGLLITVGAARLLETLLLGLDPIDPVSFIAAPAILVAVSVAAMLLPARHAARIDPLTALRTE